MNDIKLYRRPFKLGLQLWKITVGFVLYGDIRVYLSNDLTRGIGYLRKRNTMFPHPVGIVIGKDVEIGRDCIVYQNVTIGGVLNKQGIHVYPKIGNNVIIYANSIIIGDISIGDDVVIGAGTFVNRDIPSRSLVYGLPLVVKPNSL